MIDPIDFVIFGIPAITSISLTYYHQRIGDLWAKTIVIDRNYKKMKSFYSRSKEEQNKLIQNTWCDKCKTANTELENLYEYEQNGKLFITGFCYSCGREITKEIKTEMINE